jgi:hypothetical protein
MVVAKSFTTCHKPFPKLIVPYNKLYLYTWLLSCAVGLVSEALEMSKSITASQRLVETAMANPLYQRKWLTSEVWASKINKHYKIADITSRKINTGFSRCPTFKNLMDFHDSGINKTGLYHAKNGNQHIYYVTSEGDSCQTLEQGQSWSQVIVSAKELDFL